MYASTNSLALVGIEAQPVQIQIQISSGIPAFSIVGLADKSVHESQSRIKAALVSMGLALPPKRITINLQPANQPKEGSHYDLPIALGLMAAMGVLSADELAEYVCLGELGLDGYLVPVPGVLPAAVMASDSGRGLICPKGNGAEAAWVEGLSLLSCEHLLQLISHFKGTQSIPAVSPNPALVKAAFTSDMADIQGQYMARKGLELAAVGGHNILMTGPPGAGKSMLAERLVGILPDLLPSEALEVSMIQSVSGLLRDGQLQRRRPYRDPHYSTSVPAMVGGGTKALPGEVTLAHRGVLFLDEFPEFSRQVLEALRQPIESKSVTVARVNAHITYPARFQLVAAMNPCRCGMAMDNDHYCPKLPRCVRDYQSKISGPMMDRIDVHLAVPKMSIREMIAPKPSESSEVVRGRVIAGREFSQARYRTLGLEGITCNAELPPQDLEKLVSLQPHAQEMLLKLSDKKLFSARGYHRMLRLSRSIADLTMQAEVTKEHVAEAMSFRRIEP